MSLKGIPSKVESNLRARATSGKNLLSKEVETGKKFVTDIMALKPVVAVVDVVVDSIDHVGDFVKEQAGITRNWAQI